MAGTAIKESETPPELRKEIMRDIKFRAWDKINKIMLSWEDIYGTPVASISTGNGKTVDRVRV